MLLIGYVWEIAFQKMPKQGIEVGPTNNFIPRRYLPTRYHCRSDLNIHTTIIPTYLQNQSVSHLFIPKKGLLLPIYELGPFFLWKKMWSQKWEISTAFSGHSSQKQRNWRGLPEALDLKTIKHIWPFFRSYDFFRWPFFAQGCLGKERAIII